MPDVPSSLARSPAAEGGVLVTHVIEAILLVMFALGPLAAIGYILAFRDPALRFESHVSHELAIGVAIAESAFITFVTWRCYRSSGEPFLRWLTLSFLSFTLLYAPHGLFTRMADDHLWLFLFYGPVSRFVMAIFLLTALFTHGAPVHRPNTRNSRKFWITWAAALIALDLALAWVSLVMPHTIPTLRLVAEYGALALLSVGALLAIRPRSPLFLLYGVALAVFAQSSLAFIIAKPWDHLWWLAHLISASGFLLLSYGVLHAYHTTRSFSLVFRQDEVIEYLRAAKAHADASALRLTLANQQLEHLAATDTLTGIANRRHFFRRAEAEIARATRGSAPLALLALDLDHFKNINDTFGHATGDQVLQRFCAAVSDTLRPSDLLGRLGGEEFAVLLPEAGIDEAKHIGERIRAAVENMSSGGDLPPITTSIGISAYDADGGTLESLLRHADRRLYQAKHDGGNVVIASDAPAP